MNKEVRHVLLFIFLVTNIFSERSIDVHAFKNYKGEGNPQHADHWAGFSQKVFRGQQ